MRWVLVLVIACIFASVFVQAETNFVPSNETTDVMSSLEEVNASLNLLKELNFSTQRYEDTMFLAFEFFNAQYQREKNNNTPDYTFVEQKISELQELEENAYLARDELRALEFQIDSLTLDNMSNVNAAYATAKKSFDAERYEEAINNIDTTYQVISETEASETRVRALYDVTTRNLKSFLSKFWPIILIVAGALFVIGLIMYPVLGSLKIKRHIHKLLVREHAIDTLIANSQKEYFDSGKLSEASYTIRMKKYRELLREIHREIPVMRENFALLQKVPYNIIRLKLGDTYGKNTIKKDEQKISKTKNGNKKADKIVKNKKSGKSAKGKKAKGN